MIYASNFLPPDSVLKHYAFALAQEDYDHAREAIAPLRSRNNLIRWSEDWADLLEASILMFEQTDYNDTSGLALYISLQNKSEKAFLEHLSLAEGKEDSVAALFALGTLEGFEATRLDQISRTFKAFKEARHSTKHLRQAYKLDTTLIDAALGFSLYDYWTSRILRPLHWTPLSGNRCPEALARIEMVAHKGIYARYLASAYLAWIWVEEDEYELAISVADSQLTSLGEVRSFLEPCAKAYFLMERWKEARNRYERLTAAIRNAPKRNLVREVGALHRLAIIAAEQEDWKAVIEYANLALTLPLSEKQFHRKKADIKRLRKYRKIALERKCP